MLDMNQKTIVEARNSGSFSSGGSDGQTFPFGLHWFGRFDFYEPTPNQNQKMQTKLSLFQTGVQTKLTEFHTDI